jgi:transposase-like protein
VENQSSVNQVIEGHSQVTRQCPHCQNSKINRHGYSNGLQRYRCNTCAKTFTALTGTPLCGLHQREKWLEQAKALSEGRTLRRVAEQVGIHVSTAHRWRNRFLSSPKSSPPEILTGIAEADETYLLLSFKGKRGDAKYHHSKETQSFITSQKGIGKGEITMAFLPAYSPELNPDGQVWNHAKARLAKLPVASKEAMKKSFTSILRSIQKSSSLIKSFFKIKDTLYISEALG